MLESTREAWHLLHTVPRAKTSQVPKKFDKFILSKGFHRRVRESCAIHTVYRVGLHLRGATGQQICRVRDFGETAQMER